MEEVKIIQTKKRMTQEDKDLILKDLSARLYYNVIVHVNYLSSEETDTYIHESFLSEMRAHEALLKAYLRPMSSMTDEERDELYSITHEGSDNWTFSHNAYVCLDWLNEKHFDYRGLIEKGLALEAKAGMYK